MISVNECNFKYTYVIFMINSTLLGTKTEQQYCFYHSNNLTPA